MHDDPRRGEAIEVFYSYAREDEEQQMKLRKQLASLRRQGFIVEWHDRLITPGQEYHPKILEHLESSRIILLLVSPDFIDSDYIYNVELKLAVQKHLAGEATVIPVILRPCEWEDLPVYGPDGRELLRLGELNALPEDGKPVTDWDKVDNALHDVERGVKRAVLELIPKIHSDDEPMEPPPPAPPGVDEGIYEVPLGIEERPRPSLIKALMAHLRAFARDVHLTLLEERRGSLILVLRGTRFGFERLQAMRLTGELTGLFGFELGEIVYVMDVEKEDGREGRAPGVSFAEAGEEWEREYDPAAIQAAALAAEDRGDLDAARRWNRRGIQAALSRGNEHAYAVFLNGLANIEKRSGDFARARGYYKDALGAFVRAGDHFNADVVRSNLEEVDRLEKG